MQRPPAEIGQSVDEVDTPALIVELDAFEANLQRMARLGREYGINFRPHAKTHKTPAIAQLQVKAGAIGVCCQKVSEAEVMVEGGIADVYVSNEVVGRKKVERLAALGRRARISTCIDHPDQIEPLSDAARRFGVTLGRRAGASSPVGTLKVSVVTKRIVSEGSAPWVPGVASTRDTSTR